MLEIRNLTKVYKSKGGVITKALDGVSIKFPSTGLVFLLGKSGSGKSTLLNVTGGLDKPDDGEIIIKGRNSKSFSGSDFDSYRNTFIGFIFQEYNILNDFNVEQNISLALQLQGKKNDKAAVDQILESVDLKGFGKRKPNTLSGGQKQRIAIARALIKNPEIIMADEPTGALDSNTGKQVFDTLKKLSKEKLIIVVSHDRDFAEYYGDRIIELSDGKVISDVTKEFYEPNKLSGNVEVINENVISIKNGKDISEEELKKIYNLLKENEGEIIISKGQKQIPLIKQVNHIRDDNHSEVFENTKEVTVEEFDGTKTKFIKSRLPFSRAFKMGSSSLKSKPIRMLFTVFLTVVALTMFGVASTLLFYDSNYSIASGLESSSNDYEAVYKSYDSYWNNLVYNTKTKELSDESYRSDYSNKRQGYYSKEEIDALNRNNVGHYYSGVFGQGRYYSNYSFREFSIPESNYYILESYKGFIDDSFENLRANSGFNLSAGRAPENKNEVAISLYMANAYVEGTQTLNNINDLIDKEVTIGLFSKYGKSDTKLKIVGIYDCGQVPSKFDDLKTSKNESLSNEFESYIALSYHAFLYVSSDFYEAHTFEKDNDSFYFSCTANGVSIMRDYSKPLMDNNSNLYFLPSEFTTNVLKYLSFKDLDGNSIEYKAPQNNEVYISQEEYENSMREKDYTVFNRLSNMIDNSYYNYEFYTYLKTNNNQKTVSDKRDDVRILFDTWADYKNSEDYTFLMNLYNEYYPTFIEHYWYVKALGNVLDEIMDEGKTSELTNYDEIRTNYYNFFNADKTFDDYQTNIKDVYDANKTFFDKMLKNYYAKFVASAIQNAEYDKSSSIPESVVLANIELANKVVNDFYTATDEDIDTIYALNIYVDENFTDTDYALEFNLDKYTKTKNNKYYLANMKEVIELKVLGYVESFSNYLLSLDFVKTKADSVEDRCTMDFYETIYQEPADAKYSYAITKTEYTKDQIADLLVKHDTYHQEMTNSVYQIISNVVSLIKTLKKVFLIVGIVFAVFASLMLFNFISSSISSKIKEIGILRAIGTRGSDLFKIFFSESGIIATICFVLAIIASIVTCYFMNKSMAEGIGIKIMDFSILNSLIIIAGSFLIAAVGTFIPVFIASKKAPIESIRTL